MDSSYQIVVVDAASDDGTPEVLRELAAKYPIETIRRGYNRGLGETARDGFEYIAAVGTSNNVVVRMD